MQFPPKLLQLAAFVIIPAGVVFGGSALLDKFHSAPNQGGQPAVAANRTNTLQESEAITLVVDAQTLPQEPPAKPESDRQITALARRAANSVDALLFSLAGQSELIFNNIFRFEVTTVSHAYHVSKEEIRQTMAEHGAYLFQSTPQSIRESLERMPWVEQARVKTRLYPLRLELEIKEAEPWLVAEYEGASWLVSSAGKLLQPLTTISDAELIVQASELARLDGLVPERGVESYLSSQNARFRYAVSVLRFFELGGGFPFAVERFTLEPHGALLVHPVDNARFPEVELIASSFEEAQSSLARLGAVLDDTGRRQERVKRIDLRFQNQAILR